MLYGFDMVSGAVVMSGIADLHVQQTGQVPYIAAHLTQPIFVAVRIASFKLFALGIPVIGEAASSFNGFIGFAVKGIKSADNRKCGIAHLVYGTFVKHALAQSVKLFLVYLVTVGSIAVRVIV